MKNTVAIDHVHIRLRNVIVERKEFTGVRFVLQTGAVDGTWFPEFEERRAVASRVAQRVGATFVPLQARFTSAAERVDKAYWIADGVHPTPPGHALIAEGWRASVGV